ncbi:hypothetical protein FHS43_006227 [Streptosporangium becharense]|uniref:Uncharacterized protein n=1 Tax=Streptosporangium becharense TaxID=1816182 RepID=A0A7W9MHB3_9ACTN|nr:hypothetical protein [Streptosporangium becharense]MBB2914915.1 hypothetical protein [Streptosporangium becharense]MBB5820274.1 hypothetical protein [Streptosporangium becharense]
MAAPHSKVDVPAGPLEMANNLVAAVGRLVDHTTRDPMEAVIYNLPARAVACAEQAERLAMVSIAQDLRRIADHLTGSTAERVSVQSAGEPDVLDEALLDEARRHSTGYLRDTYARGIEFGHPWPSLKNAIEQVLAERGEPIHTPKEL